MREGVKRQEPEVVCAPVAIDKCGKLTMECEKLSLKGGWKMRRTTLVAMAAVLIAILPLSAQADIVLQEDFNTVTESGGGEFFVGSGELVIDDWDSGISNESAFAGTTVRAYAHVAAGGAAAAGVDASGAGTIAVSDVSFNPLHLSFENISGNPGGGVFMDAASGDESYMENWDNNIEGEAAFGGVSGGAVLTGTMSAQALQGAGYAELDVNGVNVGGGMWWAGMMFAAPALEGAVVLENPGFDDDGALPPWTPWGNALSELGANGSADFTPLSGARALKMYGTFTGSYDTSGVWQELPAEPGQTWQLDCFVQHVLGDDLATTQNFVEMKIEFRDASSAIVGTNGVVILDALSPTSVWIDAPAVQATAPAGTAVARALLVFHQPAIGLYEGGAGIIDNVSFEVVAGPPQSAVDLSVISLTANIQGVVDAAGETLGDYQLRIEDSDGDRLVFSGTADGTWQSVGGPLSTATEVNSNGVPATGVFNTDSQNYTVVVTFDNDTAVTWGTGGTLNIDEIILSGSEPLDSQWYAGLFWNDLGLPSTDLDKTLLTADVKGDVPGGEYVLRVEGIVFNSNGIEESFDDMTGLGEQVILNLDMTTAGVYSGWSNNWDTGIVGEAAFGGIPAGSVLCTEVDCPGLADVGITAKAIASGGNPGAYAQIKCTGLWNIAPGGDWYGGLIWLDQSLASTDLSQVTLTADVKGYADILFGEILGSIELRIEDDQGDRLYVRTTATTGWQTIGGTLDTFTEAGRAGGGGDGTFNLDSLNYTVVIAFDEPYATWVWGGAIQVDNVYLTPADVAVELGSISFTGVADGNFQTVGGLLSEGDSTFAADLDEDFENAAGDSLAFWPGNWGAEDFDSGLEGEAYFAGTWNAGTLGAATARTCLDCGYNGTAGVQMIVENPTGARWTGGWWAGLAWNNQQLEITDLSQIIMTARIKAEPTVGTDYGTVAFKLEDPNLDAMQFLVVADGTWQNAGGPLSTATMVASGDTSQGSDGVFDMNAPWYKVVISTWGPTDNGTPGVDPDWTSSHVFTVDDLFLTKPGRSIEDAESYTVTLAFENELDSWGTAGTLTLDNLLFASLASSCDGDEDLDLADFANFQRCFGGDGTGDCSCADVDGDGDVDLADYDVFAISFAGPF